LLKQEGGEEKKHGRVCSLFPPVTSSPPIVPNTFFEDRSVSAARLGIGAFDKRLAAAIEVGEHEAALAVYKGQFLEGLFGQGASPEYNEWVDDERNGFRRSAGQAASALSIQAERRGDFTDAVAGPAGLRRCRPTTNP
jgi:hypothetical protein